jgi:F-box interacting protein
LPVNDVLRCTSVCKSWYLIITSPSFTSLHLNLSSPNLEPRIFLQKIENSGISYSLHHDNETFDEIAELGLPVYRPWQIIDGLNGLFCLFDTSEDCPIMLWNPSIRKSFVLPKPWFSSKGYSNRTIGFGFLPATNEHKVIMFSFRRSKPKAAIFELSTGSWRVINLGGNSYAPAKADVWPVQARSKDILHWSASCISKEFSTTPNWICSFDMKNENFGTLMVPSCLCDNDNVLLLTYADRESLYLAEYTDGLYFCTIWIMKEYGVADSWEKLFSMDRIEQGLIFPHYFRHNGEILCERSRVDFDGSTELISYDYNNNQVKNVVSHATPPPQKAAYHVHTYVESLFLVQSPSAVKIDEESAKISKNMRSSFTGLLLD